MFRRRHRRMRTGKFKKKSVAWRSSVFQTQLTQDGTANDLIFYDPMEGAPVDQLANFRTKIVRVVCQGEWCNVVDQGTSTGIFASGLHAVLHVSDAEDTDSQIVTGGSAGEILSSQRILWRNAWCAAEQRLPDTIYNVGSKGRIDIDWKGGCWLRQDENLFLTLQWDTSLVTPLDLSFVALQVAVLYEMP